MDNPKKIQYFFNRMKMNFEEKGDTNFSPITVLKKRKCHCLEGAVLAALVLRVHGQEPLVLDLKASRHDFDHVVALFKKDGMWGAISKTNHAVLRYREPVYQSIRELAMSYFHEYIDKKGRKSLRSYSVPVHLKRFDKLGWMTTREEIDYIPEYLDEVKHFQILTRKQTKSLRQADKIEIKLGNIVEWKKRKKTR